MTILDAVFSLGMDDVLAIGGSIWSRTRIQGGDYLYTLNQAPNESVCLGGFDVRMISPLYALFSSIGFLPTSNALL